MIVTDSEVDEMPFYAGVNVFGFNGNGELASRSVTHFSNEPSDVAIDSAGGRRFYADDTARKIFQVEGGPDGSFGTDDDIVSGFDTTLFHSRHPEGLSYGQDSLFVADGPGAEIFRVTPGPNGEFDGSAPLGDDVVSSFDTAAVGVRDPEAVAYAKETGTLLVVDHAGPLRIVEMTTAGDLVRVIDVSDLPVVAPAAVALGPASDGSGGPHVYVADRGVDNAQSATENDGRIYELRVEPGPAPVLANGGFEFDGDLDQRPDGWILAADAIGTSATVHSGKRALSLAVSTDGQTVARQAGRAVEEGTAYLVRAWTRSLSAADMHVEFRLTWRGMDGTVIRSDRLLTTARPGSTWAESVAPVTSPSNAVGVQLSIGFGPAGATAVIDDISLEPVVGK